MYAVTVSIADLVVASRAFTSMKPTLLGLRLIQARRKDDKLGSHYLNSVPVEVWSMIKDQLRAASMI